MPPPAHVRPPQAFMPGFPPEPPTPKYIPTAAPPDPVGPRPCTVAAQSIFPAHGRCDQNMPSCPVGPTPCAVERPTDGPPGQWIIEPKVSPIRPKNPGKAALDQPSGKAAVPASMVPESSAVTNKPFYTALPIKKFAAAAAAAANSGSNTPKPLFSLQPGQTHMTKQEAWIELMHLQQNVGPNLGANVTGVAAAADHEMEFAIPQTPPTPKEWKTGSTTDPELDGHTHGTSSSSRANVN